MSGNRLNRWKVVNALFDVTIRNVRVDPVGAVGVSNRLDFWPQKSSAAERKKGPDYISRTDRVDRFGHLDNCGGGQPIVRLRIDKRPTHVRDAVACRVNAYAINRIRSHCTSIILEKESEPGNANPIIMRIESSQPDRWNVSISILAAA